MVRSGAKMRVLHLDSAKLTFRSLSLSLTIRFTAEQSADKS